MKQLILLAVFFLLVLEHAGGARRHSMRHLSGVQPKHETTTRARARGEQPDDTYDNTDAASSSSIHSVALSAAKSLSSASLQLVKSSIKNSVDVLSPKHVQRAEILGPWRIEQTIHDHIHDSEIIEAVTVQLFRNGTLSTRHNGITEHTEYSFISRKWPRFCTISFKAPLHIDRASGKPVNMLYSGHFLRPLFSNEVILWRGAVSRIQGNFL
jgi:hypothetical protein